MGTISFHFFAEIKDLEQMKKTLDGETAVVVGKLLYNSFFPLKNIFCFWVCLFICFKYAYHYHIIV